MKKLAFWFLLFFGFMCWFLRAVAIEVNGFDGATKMITNLGITVVILCIVIYGTPNGFIRGLKNRHKGDGAQK